MRPIITSHFSERFPSFGDAMYVLFAGALEVSVDRTVVERPARSAILGAGLAAAYG